MLEGERMELIKILIRERKKALLFAILLSVFCFILIPSINTSDKSLRELAEKQNMEIGTAVNTSAFLKDKQYRDTLKKEFNVLTLENELKFASVHPQIDRYDFTNSNRLIDFAMENNQKVRGHTLVWYYDLPDWLTKSNFSRDQFIQILKNHIQTVVGQYRGKIYAWDVVNEAFNDDGTLRDNLWLRKIGPEYIELAFRWAHEADPNALLFYNDNRNEGLNAKSESIYRLFKEFKERGVPVNGIGFQMHNNINKPIRYEDVSKNIERLANIGLQVQITEMDVQIQGNEEAETKKLKKQADMYKDSLNVCLSNKNCTGFVMWGFTDKFTWVRNSISKDEQPLIFDEIYKPKPAYKALQEVLYK
ncbi:endo-1,4-beta-xylanase [Bacillus sp. CGMCC 1.60114]